MSETLWTRFIDLQARPITRRLRRLCVGSYLFMIAVPYAGAVINLVISSHHHSRLDGVAAFISTCQAMGLAIFWMAYFRRVNSTISLDDRAQLDFGVPYARLSAKQRFDVWVRVRREMQAGGRAPDERDSLAQREAERLAFRALRVGLPVLAIAFWVVCFFLPPGQLRMELLVAAAAVSGVTILAIILPDVIRMWTQPDDVGEPKLAERGA